MGLTLIEAAKYESRLEHLAVIKTFAEGELLSWLPFMNIAGGGLFYSVEKELPTVGFRAVNEGYKQSYGVVDPQSEAVHLFGGDVDVDRSIVDLQGARRGWLNSLPVPSPLEISILRAPDQSKVF